MAETETFNPDIGHPEIQAKILNSIKSDRMPHAYLFYGQEGSGKEAFAIEVAKLLNCEKGPLYICRKCSQCVKISQLQHPDVTFVFPTPSSGNIKPEDIDAVRQEKARNPFCRAHFPGKNAFIAIDTIRELKREAKYKLYEGKKKVFIISEADAMRPEAANALLKILEEPPRNLMLILVTSRIHRILPTIRSRCQLIHFPPLQGDLILKIVRTYRPDLPENISRIIRLALNNVKLAFDFLEDNVLEKRDRAIDFLRKIVLIEKSHELLQQIDAITAARDRREMRLLLFFLLTWFRDALHYRINPRQSDLLINSDLGENIGRFVNAYPAADYRQLIHETESAIRDLEDPRNLNPALIFTNLAIKLNYLIRKK